MHSPRLLALRLLLLACCLTACLTSAGQALEPRPVKAVILRMTHGHVHGFLASSDRSELEIVGIYEPQQAIFDRYQGLLDLASARHHTDLAAMLDDLQPEVALICSNTHEHLELTKVCAARGIHVMVEKPLAVNSEHAHQMAAAARAGGIHLLTNYETTWYASNHRARTMLKTDRIGPLRRLVVRSGHQGPVEIGCSAEFVDWLTDPVLNGGGALTDFGCYGINLATWLQDGQRPTSVSATVRTLKPDVYRSVDDDATIVLEYPGSVAIVQGSWNWSHSRKEMVLHGATGVLHAESADQLTLRRANEQRPTAVQLRPLPPPADDPLRMLAALARGETEPDPLSSLENNLIVVEILDAAKRSAQTGQRIELPQNHQR